MSHVTRSKMLLTETCIRLKPALLRFVTIRWCVSSSLVTAQLCVPSTYLCMSVFCAGIGGSYMCIYPMDSPGGYQLVGRTLPIWNTFGRTGPFTADKPWLLEFFDQVSRLLTQALPAIMWHRHQPRLLLLLLGVAPSSHLIGPG